jgi:hypothetical protein
LLFVHGGALECQRGSQQLLLYLRDDILYQLLGREWSTLALLKQLPAACGAGGCTFCEEHRAVRGVSGGAVDCAKLRGEFGGAQPQRKVCVRRSRIEMW